MAGSVAAWALCAATAAAQEIVDPRWESIPSPEALSEAYPQLASSLSLPGWARLRCTSLVSGHLANCRVVSESPEGLGFGRAALAVSDQFRIAPGQRDGEARKSDIVFTSRFLMAAEPPPPPWRGAEPDADHVRAASALASLIQGPKFDIDPDLLGVDDDRAEATRDALSALIAQFSQRAIDAAGLAMARIMTRAQIDALAEGRIPPGKPPTEEEFLSASDRLFQVNRELEARMKAWYCDSYDCVMRPYP